MAQTHNQRTNLLLWKMRNHLAKLPKGQLTMNIDTQISNLIAKKSMLRLSQENRNNLLRMKIISRKENCLELKGNEFATNLCAVSFVPRPKPIIQWNKRRVRIIKDCESDDKGCNSQTKISNSKPFSSMIVCESEDKKGLNGGSITSEEIHLGNKRVSNIESRYNKIAKTSIEFYKESKKGLVLGILESRYHKDYIQELINSGSRKKISTDKVKKAIMKGKKRIFTNFKTEINKSKVNKPILYIGLIKKRPIKNKSLNITPSSNSKFCANNNDSFCNDAYLDNELKLWIKGNTNNSFRHLFANENGEQKDWSESNLFVRVMNGDIYDIISEEPILMEKEVDESIKDNNKAKSTLLALYKDIGLKSLLKFMDVVYY